SAQSLSRAELQVSNAKKGIRKKGKQRLFPLLLRARALPVSLFPLGLCLLAFVDMCFFNYVL
ncbi:MAG: hypothetical protein FWH02_08880, partial [Oscillospiraceae bacterium]|nr:hypothetical protein [Oscillospiraceae bacterium]